MENKEQPKSRESGYYWVRFDHNESQNWEIAQFIRGGEQGDSKDRWGAPFIAEWLTDADFIEIDERKISRVSGEPPKPDLWKEVAMKQDVILDQIKRTATAWTPETVKRFEDLQTMFNNAMRLEGVSGEAKTADHFDALVEEWMKIKRTEENPVHLDTILHISELIQFLRVGLTGGSVPTPSDEQP